MTTRGKIIAVVAALAMFWALVSPMIPTPTAVHHGKQSVVAAAIAADFVMAAIAPRVLLTAPLWTAGSPQLPDLLDLT